MTASLTALRDRIRAAPWKAIAVAFALGAYAALEAPRVPRNRIVRSGYATIGAIAVRFARLAFDRSLAETARSWLRE
jgi:hypothetical protein